jgi:hypothetical protein
MHCMQMFNMPYTTPYHQQHNGIPWPNVQPVFSSMGGVPQTMYNPCFGTSVAPSNAYNNHNPYASQSRDTHFDGTSSGHVMLPQHNRPQGPPFGSPASHMTGAEYYTSGPVQSSGVESHQTRARPQCFPGPVSEGGAVAAMGPGSCGPQRQTPSTRDTRGGRVETSKFMGA